MRRRPSSDTRSRVHPHVLRHHRRPSCGALGRAALCPVCAGRDGPSGAGRAQAARAPPRCAHGAECWRPPGPCGAGPTPGCRWRSEPGSTTLDGAARRAPSHRGRRALVRVRRLLCETRPDRGGPLRWAADGCTPAAGGARGRRCSGADQRGGACDPLPGRFASPGPGVARAAARPGDDAGLAAAPRDALRGPQGALRGLRRAMAPVEVRAGVEDAGAAGRARGRGGLRPEARAHRDGQWWQGGRAARARDPTDGAGSWEVECAAARASGRRQARARWRRCAGG